MTDRSSLEQEFMADVEVRAAHNVIEACAQTETMEKVVFTSSVTAVIWRDDRKSIPDLDETHWTDINFSRKYKVRLTRACTHIYTKRLDSLKL